MRFSRTNNQWIVVTGAIALILALGEAAVAQEFERLTGHGTVLMTVSSGGATIEGVGMKVDFRLSLDGRQHTGELTVETLPYIEQDNLYEGLAPPVVIDGVSYGLLKISAGPPFQVATEGRRLTFSSTNGLVTLTAPSGRTTFEGALQFEGDEGGAGTPLRFSFHVGGHERSAITAAGTWQTQPGVQFFPKLNVNPNQLLSGLYSGEFHGLVSSLAEQHEVMGVFVIGFDGHGGVTGGRITFRGIGPHPISTKSSYQIDSDGFGELSIGVFLFPEPMLFHIAVFDGGKGAKIGLSTVDGFVGVSTTGEMRKQ